MTEKDIDNLGETTPPMETPTKENSPQEAKTDPKPVDELTKKRYKEQLEGSKQEALRKEQEAKRYRELAFETAYKAVGADGSELLELHKKDPDLANEVARKFGYKSFYEARETITGERYTLPERDKPYQEETKPQQQEDFDTLYQKRRAEERHQEALEEAESQFSKLDVSLQQKAKDYFNKITDGKLLTNKDAREFAEMATLYVSKDKVKAEKYNEGIAQLGNTGISSAKNVTEGQDNMVYVIRDGKLVLVPNNQ